MQTLQSGTTSEIKKKKTYDPLHILGSSSQNDKKNDFMASCTGGRCARAAKMHWTAYSRRVK